MTTQEKEWFAKLVCDRNENSRTLEKPSMRGIQRSVVDKYSDQAHFIYELLQNADDVKATFARFELRNDGLLFAHNGETKFSISDPNKEEDSRDGILGHINAITSIANSNKTESSIGKFGVGFKAVFQYTKTPHIYDPNFRFKIERFIVPAELPSDFVGRKSDDTVFWFPFDHDKKQPKECYDDIAEKLKALIFPSLFLSNLEEIKWQVGTSSGVYLKITEEEVPFRDIVAKRISLLQQIDSRNEEEHSLWLLSRNCEEGKHPYSVGFFLKGGKLTPAKHPAFCFFPTKANTDLAFIVHAPFLLTDSREGIKEKENWNKQLIQNLAVLAADGLLFCAAKKLIEDDIVKIIPIKNDTDNWIYTPFYGAIKAKFQSESLLPSSNATYVPKSIAFWANDYNVLDLFSDEQLASLTKTPNVKWVFRSIAKSKADVAISEYVDGGRTWANREPNLIKQSYGADGLLNLIDAAFIEKQSNEWLHKFYTFLSERESYQKIVRQRPIFHDKDGKAVAAYDSKDNLILFLPDDDISGYVTIRKELLENKTTREFTEKFGIKKPNLRDEINNKIIPLYSSNNEIDTFHHFKKFFRYFKDCGRKDEAHSFINSIKDLAFLIYTSESDKNDNRGKAAVIYLPTEDLKIWFETKPDTKFLSLEKYREIVGESDHKNLDDFLSALGVNRNPIITERKLQDSERKERGLKLYSSQNHEDTFIECHLDGLKETLDEINFKRSHLLWKFCLSCFSKLEGVHAWFHYSNQKEKFEASEVRRLKTEKWLLNTENEFVSVNEVTFQTLSDEYDKTSVEAQALIGFWGIRKTPAVDLADILPPKQFELWKLVQANDLTPEDLQEAIAKKHEKATQSSFPSNTPVNPERRAEKVAEEYQNAPERKHEMKLRSVADADADAENKEARVYLREQYTDADGRLHCQFCGKTISTESPFQTPNGEWHFEIARFSKSIGGTVLPINYLCCCHNHAAQFHFINNKELSKLETSIRGTADSPATGNHKFPVTLLGKSQTIYFTDTHLKNLRTLLQNSAR